MTLLSRHHLFALLTLSIVHRNATLTALHKYDKSNYRHREKRDNQQCDDVDVTLTCSFKRLTDCTWQSSDDAGKDQQRNAVTNATFCDLLTQPHHEYRARHEGGYSYKMELEACGKCNALASQTHRYTHGLNQR